MARWTASWDTRKIVFRVSARNERFKRFTIQTFSFLERLNTSPDARPAVKYIDNLEHLYVMQRYRETHDFTHIALEQKTNMLGEVTVKYFEGIQYGLPMCVTGGIFGGARLMKKFFEQ